MAAYNRRDLFAHWIRKDEAAGRPCLHACCRGLRAHPEGYPVAKRRAWLRYSSDQDVADYYNRHGSESEADTIARDQALAEMQRRDEAEDRREAAQERRRARYTARRDVRREERERIFTEAETATTGYMLNRRGREAKINPRSLITGPESRLRKYGSDELLDYFEHHPRPTEAYFEGRETRLGRGYSPRSRMTSEEQEWRDRFERETWPIEPIEAA